MSMERYSKGLVMGVALVLGLACSRVEAASTLFDLTPHELAMLPAWCREVQHMNMIYGTPGGQAAWIEKVGREFMHMHHYCEAQIGLMRADRARVSDAERKRLLQYAYNNYTYVIRNTTPSFIFLPEVYVQRANTQIRQNKYQDAFEDLQKAKTLRADYVPIYLALAHLFQESGEKKRARAALEEGLKVMPTSNVLRQALSEYDTKSQ